MSGKRLSGIMPEAKHRMLTLASVPAFVQTVWKVFHPKSRYMQLWNRLIIWLLSRALWLNLMQWSRNYLALLGHNWTINLGNQIMRWITYFLIDEITPSSSLLRILSNFQSDLLPLSELWPLLFSISISKGIRLASTEFGSRLCKVLVKRCYIWPTQ